MRQLRNDILVLILCLVSILTSCTIRPRGVLSERRMIDLLFDLHRADGTMQVSGVVYNNENELAAYYASVLEKHGVTQAQFDSSLVWYTDNPNIFDKMYPYVIEKLEHEHQLALEASVDASEREKMKNSRIHELDSIMQIPLQHQLHLVLFDYQDTVYLNTIDTIQN